jgi:recombination protein RecA
MNELAHRLAAFPPLSRALPTDPEQPDPSAPSVLSNLRRWRQSPESPFARQWKLDNLMGRFVEISRARGTASLTAAASLILEAQQRKEPSAWVAVGGSIFFPPDFASSGIDLAALPVVRIESCIAAARVADHLLRCGAFAVVVLDLQRPAFLSVAVQTRLAALAKKHSTALLCLTRTQREMPSLGTLVSLRGAGALEKTGFDRFTWTLDILKDKRQGPGWSHAEVCHGPDGLC